MCPILVWWFLCPACQTLRDVIAKQFNSLSVNKLKEKGWDGRLGE